MKVGDLVIYSGPNHENPPVYGPGIIMRFDRDNDPVVLFHGDTDPDYEDGCTAFYRYSLEVISERR